MGSVSPIQCKRCGKRKSHHPFAQRNKPWVCNSCKNANKPKATIICVSCNGSITLRATKIILHDYYICGPCDKVNKFQHPVLTEEEVLVREHNAAGGFTGYTRRIANAEEKESHRRAKALLEIALRMLAEEKSWVN
jgi:hypothetical protein